MTTYRDLGEGIQFRHLVLINGKVEAVFVRKAAARAYLAHIERNVKKR